MPSANVVDTGHTGHSQAVQKVSNGLYHQAMGEFWSIHQRTEVASLTAEPLEDRIALSGRERIGAVPLLNLSVTVVVEFQNGSRFQP